MELYKPRLPRIRSPAEYILGIDQEEKRVTISASTRRRVYERGKRRCECCGKKLKVNQGEFHHLRKPTITATPKTIQFLCASDHKDLGHKWITKTVKTLLTTEKRTQIKRLKVRKHPSSPYWRELKKPRKARKSKR